jgi:cobalt-zinc-cadmium efflux system outer membrane protein
MPCVPRRWLFVAGVFPFLIGCTYSLSPAVDPVVGERAAQPVDRAATASAEPLSQPLQPTAATDAATPAQDKPKDKEPPRPGAGRLEIPRELPGQEAPPIELPKDEKERAKALERYYPPLPPLGTDTEPAPGPHGRPLTLADLQQLALANSPLIRQAAADVQAARGAVIQAGLYPNPVIGYEGDQIGALGRPGQQGGFLEQLIKTGGKLRLAQAAALMNQQNAEVALRRAEIDLATQVRAGYFAVLVAGENVKVARALARFTDEVHRIQVDKVKNGQAAPYEPMQARVLSLQARTQVVQARNRYTAAWRQLAAALGLPELPPTQLDGRVDRPVPIYQYDRALEHVLGAHTDVLTAQNTLQRARYQLRLAEVTPRPDIDLRAAVQKDLTDEPALVQVNVGVGIQVPLWDRNQGNILQAQGQLLRATEETQRVRNDLTARLAEAFERYQNNLVIVDYYRNHILPDQVRVYRAVYERHQAEPQVLNFNDVITAQQSLASAVTTYLSTLGATWAAVTDVANLLQTTDLFQLGEPQVVPALPDLDLLRPPLPCVAAGPSE